jgi:hypothetical protein
MPSPTFTLISRQDITAGTGTFTFSAIPQTYTDLYLIANLRYDGSSSVWADGGWTVNGSPSPSGIYMGGTGGGTRAGNYPGQFTVLYNNADAGYYPMNIAYFPNYAGSNIKCYWTSGSAGYTGLTMYDNQDCGVYPSFSSAITSISISGTMVQSCSASLYGIKSS